MKELEKVRNDITRFQELLAENTVKEKSVILNLQELEHDITLRQRLLKELEKAEKNYLSKINQNTRNVKELEQELKKLRDAFKSRSVYLYKHGVPGLLDLFFNSESVSQALSLRKYYKTLITLDRKRIGEISETADKIALLNIALTDDLREQKSLQLAARNETSGLIKKRSDRKKLLSTIKNEKNRVRLALDEKRKAEKRLEVIIASMNSEKPESLEGFTNFSSSRGRLPWPASGELVSHIGLEKDPDTKTQTINRGIDIQTSKEAVVIAVCDGRVSKLKWLPWYGQTLFIRHSGGYFTVYARLEEVFVNLNEVVYAGQSIGTVGFEPISSKPRLNFQIWKGADNLDPEEWLSKSSQTRRMIAQVKKNR